MTAMHIQDFIKMASLVKASQQPPQFRKHKKDPLSAAYPTYDRSLLAQMESDPRQAGATRAAGAGLVAAVLGGLVARLASSDPKIVGGAALASGAAGAIPGYISGKREAESERSRLLFLRRLGVTRPGELEVLMKHPALTHRVTAEETQI